VLERAKTVHALDRAATVIGFPLVRIKSEFFQLMYKSSVPTSQETYHFSAAKVNRLILFKEIFAVYCENHEEHTDSVCEQNVEFL
jgi:hypothetical protein